MSLTIVDAWTTRAWAQREYGRLDGELQDLIGSSYRTLTGMRAVIAEIVGPRCKATVEYTQGAQRYRMVYDPDSGKESRWQITALTRKGSI